MTRNKHIILLSDANVPVRLRALSVSVSCFIQLESRPYSHSPMCINDVLYQVILGQ